MGFGEEKEKGVGESENRDTEYCQATFFISSDCLFYQTAFNFGGGTFIPFQLEVLPLHRLSAFRSQPAGTNAASTNYTSGAGDDPLR